MRDIGKGTNEILNDILSRDSQKVWSSSNTIIKMSQDNKRIKEFIPHLGEIKAKTANLDMGGLFAGNDRFVKKVIRILEHYKNEQECSCCLFDGDDNPTDYETIDIKEEVRVKDNNCLDHYVVECKKCKQKFNVYEREYHFSWWDWQKI